MRDDAVNSRLSSSSRKSSDLSAGQGGYGSRAGDGSESGSESGVDGADGTVRDGGRWAWRLIPDRISGTLSRIVHGSDGSDEPDESDGLDGPTRSSSHQSHFGLEQGRCKNKIRI